jgi:UDP-N-acetylmuramoylalanine--D-glutamate ligase
MISEANGSQAMFFWNKNADIHYAFSPFCDYAYVENGILMYSSGGKEQSVVAESDIVIPGRHNVENYMAAICATMPYVFASHIARVAGTFSGVEHRIELLRNLDGVRYYNSSIDTSPNRTINTMNALKSRGEHGVLIAGGADKKCDYTGLGLAILSVCDRIVLCGANADLIKEILSIECTNDSYTVVDADDYSMALLRAKEMAKPGDIVILSPVGTSYDRFRHFEERGNLFKELVAAL